MKRIVAITLTCIALAVMLSAPVVAASDVEECEAVGKAEGETLYWCNNAQYYWDPSSALGSGIMDCE